MARGPRAAAAVTVAVAEILPPIAEKEFWRKRDDAEREFLPLTDEVLIAHLALGVADGVNAPTKVTSIVAGMAVPNWNRAAALIGSESCAGNSRS
ncbi:hypothetical protein [Nonomuraea sp. NPDC049784]|uniref:hypothetical protein n=1 Tax=Nonomuraea sp. NPDC049784 TaxID=3154361 RepID=UPI00340A5AC6